VTWKRRRSRLHRPVLLFAALSSGLNAISGFSAVSGAIIQPFLSENSAEALFTAYI